jgi:flagellar M-ring protein FliF
MSIFSSLFGSLRSIVAQLAPRQRLTVAAGAIGTVVAVVALVVTIGATRYEPTFVNVAPSDAAAIADALTADGIPYRLSAAGTTVEVPSERSADARVSAAAAGATAGSSNAVTDAFSGGTLGFSQFGEQAIYNQAVGRQIELAIEKIGSVGDAQLQFVPAQRSLFSGAAQPAQASVVVRLRGGSDTAAVVRSIQAIVAGGVVGLSPDQVSVVDTTGRTIGGPGGADASAMGGLSPELMARNLEAKIRGAISPWVGIDGASVAVSMELETGTTKTTSTTIDPVTVDTYTIESQQCETEHIGAGASTQAGGIPGATTNVPGLPTYATTGGTSTDPYDRTKCTANFKLGETTTEKVEGSGGIKRLSVAVLIDEAKAANADMAKIEEAIRAAAGASADRGDVVSVTTVPFAPVETAPAEMISGFAPLLGTIAAIIMGILLLLVVLRTARRIGARAEAASIVALSAEGAVDIASLLRGSRGGAVSGGSVVGDPIETNAAVAAQERLRAQAISQPEILGGVIADWVRKDEQRG